MGRLYNGWLVGKWREQEAQKERSAAAQAEGDWSPRRTRTKPKGQPRPSDFEAAEQFAAEQGLDLDA